MCKNPIHLVYLFIDVNEKTSTETHTNIPFHQLNRDRCTRLVKLIGHKALTNQIRRKCGSSNIRYICHKFLPWAGV